MSSNAEALAEKVRAGFVHVENAPDGEPAIICPDAEAVGAESALSELVALAKERDRYKAALDRIWQVRQSDNPPGDLLREIWRILAAALASERAEEQ